MTDLNNLNLLLWSNHELHNQGITGYAIRQKIKSGELCRIRHGIYATTHQVKDLKPWERYGLYVLGFARAFPSTVFSHQSAATLLGLSLISIPPKIHIYCPENSRGSLPNVSKHPRQNPAAVAVLTQSGAFATNVIATIIDCATTVSFPEATVIADSALRLKLCTLQNLKSSMLTYQGYQKARVHRVAHAISDLSESPGETLTRLLLNELGIKYHEQYWVSYGQHRYRADFYLPEYDVFIEFDGALKYTDFQPATEVIMRERFREKEFLKSGARIFRVSWNEVYNSPMIFKNQLTQYLHRVGRRQSP